QNPPAKPAPQAPPPLTVQEITKSLYLVKGGSGANAAFYIAEKEVFVIDAKMTPAAAADMLAEIRKVTSRPVTTVILTHSDGDHVNGLPGFPKGLRIIAHENVKRDMEAAAADLPALREYLPTVTYTSELTKVDPRSLDLSLRNYGPAHTDGDSVVTFRPDKAVFVGDLLFVGRDPLVHRHKNGSSFGYVKTLGAMLEALPPVETFLSGHADPLTRADVEALKASMSEKQAKVKAMIAEGKSLEDIKKAFGVEDRPAAPGGRRWLSLVETIYLELTGK
ncbi:MAG: MBL fold metallo-hydrolase, partial [Candidatus Aminicenantes bacterium]|nr:MBL fold metallo-hydrolase [Candidatus Aminicenantes bacterium]